MLGLMVIIGLHFGSSVLSGRGLDLKYEGYYYACNLEDIEDDCAKVLTLNGENIAI